MQENADKNNSEYRHFLRSEGFRRFEKQAAKMYEVMFFDLSKYVFSEGVFNIICIEIN